MVSGADNEPPAVGDPGKLGRGQQVAALEDSTRHHRSANDRFAKPVRPLTRDFIGSTPGKENCIFGRPNMQKCRAHWVSGMFDASQIEGEQWPANPNTNNTIPVATAIDL
jgi:hypothetical protein